MGLIDEADRRLPEGHRIHDLARLEDRTVEIGLVERIAEALFEFVDHLATGMKRHGTADGRGHRPKLVDPVTMVAVGVGHDHAVDPRDFGREQLLTKIGPAVDEHPLPAALHQDRGAKAGVAWLLRVALAPFVADLGNAGRRPAAQNADFHASGLWAFPNNLKKLAVVVSAN